MTLPTLRHTSAFLPAFGLAAAAFAEPTIERIAPENSVVVAGIANAGQTLDRFRQTGLWKLWRSKAVQDLVAEPLEEFEEELTQALHELGVEEEEGEQQGVPCPQGPVGLAIFPVAGADPMAGGDAEQSRIGYMLMGDYGTAAPRMGRIVEALLEKARKDGLELREQEVLGRTVYSFDLSAPEAGAALGQPLDEDMEDWEGDEDFGGMMPAPDPAEFLRSLGHVQYCRDGSRFLVSSDPEALHKALEIIDEDGRSGLDARQDFQAAMRQLGPTDGYALLLVRDLWGGLIPPDDPMMMMVQGMIKSVVGDIRALGLGMRVGSGETMVEDTFAVYMPSGKAGLTALMDLETPQGTLPPFVSPQAVVYGRGNFRFAGITPFLRSVAQTNPLIGAEINRMLAENGPMIERLCGALGPRVHTITTLSRPITMDSLRELYAIECGRPADVEAVLAEHAADWGLTSRDFMGNRIYSMNFGEMAMMFGGPIGTEDIAIGVGGGHMFVGSAPVVEDALRAGARKSGPSFADDPDFKRAQRVLKAQKCVGWGVVNLPGYLEYMKEIPDLYMKQMIAEDPEHAGMMGGADPAWGGFDVKMIAKYIGPLCWEVRSRDDGFAGRYVLLPPAVPPPDEEAAGADD